MLVRGGRVVPGFGLGSAQAFVQAGLDLQAQVGLVAGAGNIYFDLDVKNFNIDFTDSVEAFQAAGAAGALRIGPEIDAAGAPTVTKPLTHKAWLLNAKLAALPKSGIPDPANSLGAYYNQADATQAKSLATQMIALYNQAISAGSGASPAPVQPPAQAATAPATASILPVVALAAVGAAAATFVIYRNPVRALRKSHV